MAQKTRSFQIYLPSDWAEGLKQSWNMLADEVITNEEAGQRGTKASKLFVMIASASFANLGETIRLLKEIKKITSPKV